MIFLAQSIKKILQHESMQNFLIIGAVSVVQLVNNVLLGRELKEEEFGLYSLVFLTLVSLVSSILLFGQSATIIRHFSSKNIEEYEWKMYLLKLTIAVLIPVALLSYIPMVWYGDKGYNWFWFYVNSIASILMFLTWIISSLLRARGKFNSSAILERTSPLLFFFGLICSYLFLHKIDIEYSAITKLISYFYVIPVLFYILFTWESGTKKIDKNIVLDGLTLWEMSLVMLIFTSIDALLIGKILGLKTLALYSILLAIMRLFEFSYTAIFNIYSQKFSKNKVINAANLSKVVLVLIITLSGFYMSFTNILLDVIFQGKYEANFILIVLLCIYKSIALLYVLPSCYIIGQGSRREIRQMMIVNVLSIAVKVILIIAFVNQGLVGFMIAGIFGIATRTAGGYLITLRYLRS